MQITVLNGKWACKCSYMENDQLSTIPKRVFKKKFGLWALEACYDNAVALLDRFTDYMSQEAIALAREIVESIQPAEVSGDLPPVALSGLLPHQQEAIRRAWPEVGFAILHRPRCRKTATTIRLACGRFLAGQITRLVVLCPNSIKSVWADEWEKRAVAPHWLHVLDSRKKNAYESWLRASEVTRSHKLTVLVASIEGMSAGATRELVQKFIEKDGSRCMMAVDESTRIKNHKSTRTEAIWELGEKCRFRNILTGSEITRTPSDLYAQFRFLGVHCLGFDSFYPFRNRYTVMGGFEGKVEIGAKNVPELMAKISKYAHLVKTSDIVDLPEKTFSRRLIDPTPEQKNYIKQLKDEMIANTPEGEEVTVRTAMTAMLRAQQIAGGFFPDVKLNDDGTTTTTMIPLKKNPKLDELMEIISEEPDKVLIWGRFRSEIQAIVNALSKKYGPESVVQFHGGTDLPGRAAAAKAFQTDESVRYLVANPQAAGMGQEFSRASLMVWYSQDFVMESRIQALERCTNIDKVNQVAVIDLVLDVKPDRAIMESIDVKKDIMDYVEDAIHSGKFTLE